MPEQIIRAKISKMRSNPNTIGRNRHYWSEDEIKNLKNMFYDGVGVSEIAVNLGRSERTVVTKFNELGLYGTQNLKRLKPPMCQCCDGCPHFEAPEKCNKPAGDANV